MNNDPTSALNVSTCIVRCDILSIIQLEPSDVKPSMAFSNVEIDVSKSIVGSVAEVKAASRITRSFSAPSWCRRRQTHRARTPPRGERSTLSIGCRRPHWNRSMLFRRSAGAGSRRYRSRRHFRSNCTALLRIAMRIGESFPVRSCDKSCTLFRCLRRMCIGRYRLQQWQMR